MTDKSLPQGNTGYQEDVSTGASGTTLVGQPCVIWTITVSIESDNDAIVSFSNSEGYDTNYRIEKVVLTAEKKTHTMAKENRHRRSAEALRARRANYYYYPLFRSANRNEEPHRKRRGILAFSA